MSLIIPYREELEHGNGAFITPDGSFIDIDDNHEATAKDICSVDTSLSSFLKDTQAIDQFQDGMNEFMLSKLNRQQLELYKMWFTNYRNIQNACFADFLVRILRYDKVEKVIRNSITTASITPHVRFFNYYLMDWNIWEVSPIIYNQKNNTFNYFNPEETYLLRKEDMNACEDLEYIKKYVMKKDRPLFFK